MKIYFRSYVMRGGNTGSHPVLLKWIAYSINKKSPVCQRFNLEDLFFRYGCTVEFKLLQDLNALPIPVKSGEIAGQHNIVYSLVLFPLITLWRYAIVKNLMYKTEFVVQWIQVGTKSVNKRFY